MFHCYRITLFFFLTGRRVTIKKQMVFFFSKNFGDGRHSSIANPCHFVG